MLYRKIGSKRNVSDVEPSSCEFDSIGGLRPSTAKDEGRQLVG